LLLKAAELLAGKHRYRADAVTMLVHSKNPHQAEIDVAELVDFWRFNAYYAQELFNEQPTYSPTGVWNRLDYRPLEGFIFAVPPFNFISIGGNLPTAPALMGNVTIWKPASSVVYSNFFMMKILEEAGFPGGVINFLPGDSSVIGEKILRHRRLAGIHFTGSTSTLTGMFKVVGDNIQNYVSYPRVVGETGGKDFVFVHHSADVKAVEVALLRSAFEYQGQKCSAASRAYIPRSLWPAIRDELVKDLGTVKMGPVTDFGNFINAIIDRPSFDKIQAYIRIAKTSRKAEVIFGGGCDCSRGFYIEPTIIVVKDPHFVTMEEEIFGPVLSVYVYRDKDYRKALELCNSTSPYALTGSIFARDRDAIVLAETALRDAAGNFYINDKPTGAVVGQQPFGGARASGTNDKAGSKWNLVRWISPRTIKETLDPPTDFRYPFMK
jgi:1-pyrroline-5-carboxylate dehydrogenase